MSPSSRTLAIAHVIRVTPAVEVTLHNTYNRGAKPQAMLNFSGPLSPRYERVSYTSCVSSAHSMHRILYLSLCVVQS